jgi:predicted MFS family arabinose efflux permease/uncharacterized membrane protein YoaK (UPF0700 family)
MPEPFVPTPAGPGARSAPVDEGRHRGVLVRNRLLLLLTFSSGAVDAICFLGLGKVFTAFMTGNFVFLALRIGGASGPHVASILASMGAFSLGVGGATRFLHRDQSADVWPRSVTRVLAASASAQAVFLALWIAVGGRPSLTFAVCLLGISGLAMGIQTAAVFSLGIQGVFTTAATATFTVLSGDAAHWANHQPERRRLAALLLALTGGAVAGAVLIDNARSLAPVVPLVSSTLVVSFAAVLGGARAQRSRSERTSPESAPPRGLSLRVGRRGGFAAAALALSIGMIGTTIPTPLYELYSRKFGFSELVVTLIFATYAVGVITSLLLFGRLSDQIGRRPVLLGALAVAGLGAACFLVADGLPLLLAGRAVAGLAAGVFTGTGTATLIDLAAPGKRTRATLIATVANMGGLACGPLLAGALAALAGSPLRLVFWIYVALVVIAAAGVSAMPEPIVIRSPVQLRPQLPHIPHDLRELFVDAGIAAFAGFAVLGLFAAVAPALLGQELGVTSPATVGLVVFLVFAASTIGQAILPLIGQQVALPAGCAALIAGMALLAASIAVSSLALLILAGLVAGIGHGLGFRGGLTELNEHAPSALRAQIVSGYFVIAYVGIALPAIGDGVMTQLIGLRAAGYVFAALVAAVATVGLGLLARTRRTDDAPAAGFSGAVADHPPRVMRRHPAAR